MSGGGLNYIQGKDAEELLREGESIERAIDELRSFGDAGVKALEKTVKVQEKIIEIKELLGQLSDMSCELSEVWRAIDHSVTPDWSRDTVVEALQSFNKKVKDVE